MGKCIILSRVSTSQQDLNSQTLDLFRDAEYHGFSKEDIILIEDKESAIKLSEAERNGLNNMKNSIETNDVDAVFIWEITRISRQLPMLYSIRNYLQEHKVQLYCHQPQFALFNEDWSISDTSNMVFAMFAVLAENEMRTKKERFARSKAYKKSLGRHVGGRRPFGYTIDKECHYIPDSRDSKIVQHIFELYVNTPMSTRQVAKELKSRGYFTNTALLTIMSNVQRYLKDERFVGNDTYPALVSREMYDAAQIKLANNTKDTHNKSNYPFLCKGIYHDWNTDFLLSANSANRNYLSKRYKGVSVKANIDDIIFKHAVELDKKYSKKTQFEIQQDYTKQEQLIMRKLARIETELIKNSEKLEKVEISWIEGRISDTRRQEISETYNNTIQQLKRDRKQIYLQKDYIQKQYEDSLNNHIDYDKLSTQDKIDLIKRNISKIRLKRDSRIKMLAEIHTVRDEIINVMIDTFHCVEIV